MRTYLALFAIATTASLVLTPLAIWFCRRFGILDHPGERKIHTTPIPRLGGVAIALATAAALGAMLLYENDVTHRFDELWPRLARVLGPALLIFALGIWDDLRRLPPRLKFAVQTLAAAGIWALGVRIDHVSLPLVGMLDLGLFGSVLATVFWMVAVTNAFNFIDGMDGLVGGIALFASLSVLAVSVLTGNLSVPILAAPLAGACLGFLPYNWHPARIFMGDGGSYFLGFMLGALALLSSTKTATMVSVAVPIALLGIPLLDTTLTVFRRFLRGQPLFLADGDHMHHRLLRAGYRQRAVVLVLYGLTVLFAGLAAVSMLAGPKPGAILVPLAMGALALLVVRRLGYEEFDEVVAMFKKAARFQRQVIGNQMRIRRFVQDIQTAPDAAALFRRLEEFLSETGFSACSVELWPAPPSSPQSHKEHKDTSVGSEPSNLQTFEPSNPDSSTINHQPSTFSWSWGSDSATESESWRIRIPLHDSAGAHRGWVTLSRRLEGERVLFQTASLLDAFSIHFPVRLMSFPASDLSEFLGIDSMHYEKYECT